MNNGYPCALTRAQQILWDILLTKPGQWQPYTEVMAEYETRSGGVSSKTNLSTSIWRLRRDFRRNGIREWVVERNRKDASVRIVRA